jgi:hypothetical protein
MKSWDRLLPDERYLPYIMDWWKTFVSSSDSSDLIQFSDSEFGAEKSQLDQFRMLNLQSAETEAFFQFSPKFQKLRSDFLINGGKLGTDVPNSG